MGDLVLNAFLLMKLVQMTAFAIGLQALGLAENGLRFPSKKWMFFVLGL